MECAICLEADDRPWHELSCGHCFHTECIVHALRYNAACPVCRDQPKPAPASLPASATARLVVGDAERHRRWLRRRVRLVHTNEEVGTMRSEVAVASKELRERQRALARVRREALVEAYRAPSVLEAQRECVGARRRYKRERDRYQRVVESFLGPKPLAPQHTLIIEVP